MIPTVFYTLLCPAVSLLLAWSLIRRKKTLAGVILGLLPVAIMEAILHGTLWLRIHRCLESACLARGLPADCGLTEFGCTEWSGLAALMFWAAGLAALILYAIGTAFILARERRRGRP